MERRILLKQYLKKRSHIWAKQIWLIDCFNYNVWINLLFTGDNHGGHYVVYINPSGDGRVGLNDSYNNNHCLSNTGITVWN